ncbi:hypothetical protein BKA62DRAFT_759218 [Auriculariales sp. MPI-PUGE-AT-0066]|nr:hypothetical protein BKA62DRAFT_759218 [Auriculariales sp. MPI-PUGE-AT-0066]
MQVPDWAQQLSHEVKSEGLAGLRFVLNQTWNRHLSPRDRFLQVWNNVTSLAPDARYPTPRYLDEKHPLWPVVEAALQSMTQAEDFDRFAMIIDDINLQLHDDFMQIPALNRQRREMAEEALKGNINKASMLQPYTFVDFESVQEEVEAIANDFIEKAQLHGGILHAETIQLGFPKDMIWQLPEAWKEHYPDVYQHLQKMTIPNIPFSEPKAPDLLLYALGSFQDVDPNINGRLSDTRPSMFAFSLCFMNLFDKLLLRLLTDTSGAGKTRYVLEYLAQIEWGFYFTFEVDRTTSPYGSADLTYAIILMSDQRFRLPDQDPFLAVVNASDTSDGDSEEKQQARWQSRWQNNEEIAAHAFTNLLLARLLVYEAFYKAVVRSGEDNEATLRRAWCLLQVAPHLSGCGDIFLRMFRAVRLVKNKVANDLGQVLLNRLATARFPHIAILAIDEAQSGARTFSTCFGPSTKSQATTFVEMTRPVLKPLVKTMTSLVDFKKTMVTGTKIDQNAVVEALQSTVAKQVSVDRDVAFLLGENDNAARIERVLNIFFGTGFAEDLPLATRRELLFWMQGRHRFLAVLIYGLLQAGPSKENVYDILMDLVSKLSDHDVRRPTGRSFPSIQVDNIIPRIIRGPETPENTEKVRHLETILVNFLITRRYDRHQHSDTHEKLVEDGIGRFAKPYSGKPTIRVIFNENLILVALWAWFSKSLPNGKSRLHHYLQLVKASAEPSTAGLGWEDVVAYMLWRWLVGTEPVKLSKIFDFIQTEPSWAHEEIFLLQTIMEDEDSDTGTPGKIITVPASPGTTLGLSYQTRTELETFRAIQGKEIEKDTDGIFQQRGYTFIKPDQNMGPDLLAFAQLPDGTRLLIVFQCKDWGNSLSTQDVLNNLVKLAPDEKGWWCKKGKRSKQCQSYVEAIEKLFPVSGMYEGTNADADAPTHHHDVYGGHPRCAVLRVIVAPELDELDEGTHIGPWPAAQFSLAAKESTVEEFSSVKFALEKAQDAEQKAIEEAKSSKKRRAGEQLLAPVSTRAHRRLKITAPEEIVNAGNMSPNLRQRRRSEKERTSSDRFRHAKSRDLKQRDIQSATPEGDMDFSDDIPPPDVMDSRDDLVEGGSRYF